MSTAVWTEPLTGSATGGGSILRWLGMLPRWLRGALSTSDRPAIERMMARARVLGAPVLAAASRAELLDRIDAALEQPEFGELMRERMPALTADTFASLAISAEDFAEMEPVLGKTPTAIVAGTAPLVQVCGGVIAHLLADGELKPEELRPDWYNLFFEPGIHSTIKRSLLAGVRTSVVLMAIAHAAFQKQRLEPWLALALAETYRDELTLSARLYASLTTGIEVPESVIPLEDRLDLARLQAEVEAGEFLWNSVAELAGDELSMCEVPDDD